MIVAASLLLFQLRLILKQRRERRARENNEDQPHPKRTRAAARNRDYHSSLYFEILHSIERAHEQLSAARNRGDDADITIALSRISREPTLSGVATFVSLCRFSMRYYVGLKMTWNSSTGMENV